MNRSLSKESIMQGYMLMATDQEGKDCYYSSAKRWSHNVKGALLYLSLGNARRATTNMKSDAKTGTVRLHGHKNWSNPIKLVKNIKIVEFDLHPTGTVL